jgi:hypothetical protein
VKLYNYIWIKMDKNKNAGGVFELSGGWGNVRINSGR